MSSNLSTKINLATLVHVRMKMKGKDGNMVDGIFIPLKKNHLFISEKGGLYLDLNHFPIKNPAEGQTDTHLVKQSLPKEVLEAMTDEQKKALPILGNTREWGSVGRQEVAVSNESFSPDETLPF